MAMKIVSYDAAVLLRSIGFNDECELNYCTESHTFPTMFSPVKGELYTVRCGIKRNACAPSLFQAMEWLRVEKGLHIVINPGAINMNKDVMDYYYSIMYKGEWTQLDHRDSLDDYDQVLELAITVGIDTYLK